VDDPKIETSDTELELLLVEADREDRLLIAGREDEPPEPRDALDSQILGGLVFP
jgi:hypothetical protein